MTQGAMLTAQRKKPPRQKSELSKRSKHRMLPAVMLGGCDGVESQIALGSCSGALCANVQTRTRRMIAGA